MPARLFPSPAFQSLLCSCKAWPNLDCEETQLPKAPCSLLKLFRKFPFLTDTSCSHLDLLWDWNSWLPKFFVIFASGSCSHSGHFVIFLEAENSWTCWGIDLAVLVAGGKAFTNLSESWMHLLCNLAEANLCFFWRFLTKMLLRMLLRSGRAVVCP